MPSTTCSKCRRNNPADAAFCYFDGQLLNGHGAAGPLAAGRQPFPHPFVLPSGRQCRNYDELALACHEEWNDARGLLKQGYLERFLGGLGRADLAKVAHGAALAPDQDLALDQLLDKLPTDTLQPPYLHVAAAEINLGTVPVGTDRRFELKLENRGMRLLRGTVSSDDDTSWLSLGEGARQKLFQFTSSGTIPVQVVGQRLRAGNKPLEGRLSIESNGGNFVVIVRAIVPIRAYPDGPFKGAVTPRQIAEKAKAAPKEAAVYFENGSVARWYKDNGWTYPVQGPSASGLGAVQQFFEALGLTPPPKVEVSTRSVNLSGAVGQRIDYVLQVATAEKRPVYAHGVSDQPWLKVGRANLQGRTATLPLVVADVPDRPGERLQAQVTVVANGNQRFPVAVSLTVEKRSGSSRSRPVVEVMPASAVPVATASAVAAVPVGLPAERRRSHYDDEDDRPRSRPAVAIPIQAGGASVWTHLAPLGALFLALLVVLLIDVFAPKPKVEEETQPVAEFTEEPFDPTPLIEVQFHDQDEHVFLKENADFKNGGTAGADELKLAWEPSMRFGLVMKEGKKKRLTMDPHGLTNNTVVRLDDVFGHLVDEPAKRVSNPEDGLIFGDAPLRREDGKGRVWVDWRGQWKDDKQRSVAIPEDTKEGHGGGRKSIWVYPEQKVEITQVVEIVADPQSRKLDTCLVRYVIKNNDSREHSVGLRFMLDTFIGDNDGVPFLIPNEEGLCKDKKEFTGKKVPSFIQAYERDRLDNPGTIARVQFRRGPKIEPPSRVTLGAWPNTNLAKYPGLTADERQRFRQQQTLWNVPFLPINAIQSVDEAKSGDSAVVMYWDQQPLAKGATRVVGFAYGLGNVSASEKGRLGLSVDGDFTAGGEFTLVAQVKSPKSGEELTLDLPEGFSLVGGSSKQPVKLADEESDRPISTVTWKIKAGAAGKHTLKVTSSSGANKSLDVKIGRNRNDGGSIY